MSDGAVKTPSQSSPATQIRYVLVASRPRFWLYLAGPVLVGVAYGADSSAALVTPATVALFAYFLFPANVFLYGVNDVFDREIDATNPKKGDREVHYRGEAILPLLVVACAILALGLTALLPTIALWWVALFLLLGVAYSVPPIRLKTTPLLDSISNGLYVAPAGAAYAAVAGANPPLAALVGGWLWTMGMHTFSAIPDVEPDRRAGIRTTATVLGERGALVYCGVCWLGATIAFATIDPRLGLAMVVYPVLIASIWSMNVIVDRAYWWFPAINTVVGTILVLGGLWVTVRG